MPDKSVVLRCDAAHQDGLYEWLRDEPEIRRSVRRLSSEPRPGQMGDVADIVVALGSAGGSIAILAPSLRAWILSNRASVRVVRPDGGQVEVAAGNADDVVKILREIEEGFEPEE